MLMQNILETLTLGRSSLAVNSFVQQRERLQCQVCVEPPGEYLLVLHRNVCCNPSSEPSR